MYVAREQLYLGILFLSPALVFALHWGVSWSFRLFQLRHSPLAVAAFVTFAGGFVVMIAIAWGVYLRELTGKELLWSSFYGLIVYHNLALCYFQLFGMTETARRIHILSKLYLDGPTSVAELQSEYGGARMLAVRLERLVDLQQLKKAGDRYIVRGYFFLLVAKIMAAWAKLLGFSQGPRP